MKYIDIILEAVPELLTAFPLPRELWLVVGDFHKLPTISFDHVVTMPGPIVNGMCYVRAKSCYHTWCIFYFDGEYDSTTQITYKIGFNSRRQLIYCL